MPFSSACRAPHSLSQLSSPAYPLMAFCLDHLRLVVQFRSMCLLESLSARFLLHKQPSLTDLLVDSFNTPVASVHCTTHLLVLHLIL